MACLGETAKTVMLVTVMLLLGSWNTLCTKLQFQTCAPTTDPANLLPQGHAGCPAGQTKYDKPWLNNMYMFIGEASLILVFLATNKQRRARALRAESDCSALHPDQGLLESAPRATPFYVFAIPAFCDVFGTGLATVGMQYMDSAVWQMLRSSIIIFSAILSVCFLKRRLQPFHWVATAIVFVGLVIVGLASMLDAQKSDDPASTGGSEMLFGMMLVVGAQLVSAFQMVFEEMLLTGGVKTSAKKVVGMEGLWGGFFMVVILLLMSTLPGSDDGHFESTPQGIHMLTHTPMLAGLIGTYMLSIALYNLTGMIVGKKMSAVVRCLVDSCRTFVVWGMNLFIYYFVSEDFGSAWMPHSWLTLVGFCILVFGTLLYNGVLPVPAWLLRPQAGEEGVERVLSGGLDDILAKVDLTVEGLASPTTAAGTEPSEGGSSSGARQVGVV